jgi:glycosyltransferase involved in cell wall biosynthesis
VHGASNASFWRKSGLIGIALLFRKPVIFHLHGGEIDLFYRSCGSVRQAMIRFVLNHVDRVIVVSDASKAKLAFATSARLVRIYNPLGDSDLLNMIPDELPFVRILFLARIAPNKGIGELLDAFAQVLKGDPSLVLAIAGDGELEKAKNRARELGISDSVEFHGWVDTEKKRALLRSSAIFVLPSYAEGLPMALLEAMGAGIAVIATNVGGVPDAVTDGLNGLLIAPKDTPGLVAALEKAISNHDLREKLGREAKRRIREQFMPEPIVMEIEKLYKEVAGVVPRTRSRIG